MFLHFLDSSQVGGIETHVETLVRAQNAAGYPSAIVLWRRHLSGTSLPRFESAGLRIHVADGSLVKLVRILKSEKATLLHTHGYKGGIVGRIAAVACGIKSVATFHAGERGKFPVNAYQMADEWTSLLGGRIAVSKPIADALPFKADVVDNFVELPNLGSERYCGQDISYAGRISDEKGPDIFCAIADSLSGRGYFVMHGDGPMSARLQQDHSDNVHFNGFAKDMENVWQNTGLLLMPSRKEGLPMAALEAMARGIPVAASATGALPGVIEHGVNGFLFPVGDVRAAGQAVETWLGMGKSRRKAMSGAARATIQQRYSPEFGLPAILAAYAGAGWRGDASMMSNVQSSSGR
jgi:glycosyltransferase involved in cell wall biosynthesis